MGLSPACNIAHAKTCAPCALSVVRESLVERREIPRCPECCIGLSHKMLRFLSCSTGGGEGKPSLGEIYNEIQRKMAPVLPQVLPQAGPSFECAACGASQPIGGMSVATCRLCHQRTCLSHEGCLAFNGKVTYPLSSLSQIFVGINASVVPKCSHELEQVTQWAKSWTLRSMEDSERKARWAELVAQEQLMEATHRRCPRCKKVFVKISGCAHLVCGRGESDIDGRAGCGLAFNEGESLPYGSSLSTHPLFQKESSRPCTTCGSRKDRQFLCDDQTGAPHCDSCLMTGRITVRLVLYVE